MRTCGGSPTSKESSFGLASRFLAYFQLWVTSGFCGWVSTVTWLEREVDTLGDKVVAAKGICNQPREADSLQSLESTDSAAYDLTSRVSL